MSAPPAFPLQVFFDGSCSVCAREMEAYRRKENGGRLLFVDISASGFDPTPYGFTLDAFMYEMHCIDRQGRIYRGVEAFRAIWMAFPSSTRYRLFAVLADLPVVNSLARLIYRLFARNRKFLPKYRGACRNGKCGIGSNVHKR
jgi:predicted DCC family thiol-disulfide oxidoreductase YuxK